MVSPFFLVARKIFAAKAVLNSSPTTNSALGTFSSVASGISSRENQLSLQDCYTLALKQSEKIAIKEQSIEEARARFQQSLGSILPHASFETSEKRQNGSNTNNFSLTEIPESKFVFSQPLFSGFKEFASMSASRAQKRQFEQEFRRAKQLLFTDVSDAFYLFLDYQEEIQALSEIQTALNERVEALEKRAALGRSRTSEVLSAQVRLNRNEAELELVRSQLEVSRQLLEFLTGVSIDAVIDDPDREEAFQSIEPLENFVLKAHQRPDVLAAQEAWLVSKKKITVARADYWPNASLDGNYYTKRVGNSSDVTWDATLSVSVPIFSGGETSGKVKEASAVAKEDELRFNETKRNAVLEIQNAYTRFQSASKRFSAFEKAAGFAEKNYALHKDDYEKSLVNNLDVLQALEDLHDSRRDLISSRFEAKRMYWNLLVVVGEIEY